MNAGGIWQLQLFGSLRAVRSGDEVVERFRSQKFGALLAYLALFPDRSHSREELADLFWPDAEPETGRANLRAALSSLRRQFEPPGTPEGSVFLPQGRYHVRLGSGIASDVARFDASVAAARRAATSAERAARFEEAAQVYGGPLLPGFYETWALNERERFEEGYRDAVGHLASYWEQEGDTGQALDWARRAVRAAPLSEEANAGVIRLLLAAGQEAAARRQYDEFARLLDERLGDTPSPTLRALVASLPAPAATVARPRRARIPAASYYATATAEARPPESPVAVPAVPLLPVPLTRFFGREDEIAALVARLSVGDDTAAATPARLVTITGPGGSGKTRLALEAARRLADQFPGGVFWVPLADISATGEAVAAVVAEAVGLPPAPGARSAREVAEGLLARRTHGPTLLVLDNFEHLLADAPDADAADFLGSLLTLAPSLRCLVTSRRRLLLAGESEFPLSPLATPSHPGTPARLLEFASVQMFVNRAQAARNDFQLSTRNAAAVAALCEKLEGIPLAIELAAGWAEALTPAQMLHRLERRFDLLVARRRDLPPRHRTLRATVESSYQELSLETQRFFARLSVFRGGWTLDAAAAVTGDADGALAHLAELRERSLVTARPAADGDEEAYRFTMLETLREFAEEQLGADETADLARRHATFYADLAEQAEPELRGPGQVTWLERLEREHPNLRVALAWSASVPGGDPALGLRLAAAIWRFWMLRGHFAEGRRCLERALAASADEEGARRVRAAALHGAGCLARLQGDTATARPLLEAALVGMRSAGGTPLDVAMCLQNLAIVAQDAGDYDAARAGYKEALALRRAAGDQDGAANVLNSLGVLSWDLGDVPGSRAFHEESIALRRTLGQPPRAAQLLNLASVAERQGDAAAARAWFEEGVSLARAAGNLHTLATGLGGLALLATWEGRRAEARTHFAEALRLFLEVGDLGSLAQTLEGCAAALAAENGVAAATTSAARLWGAAGAYRARTGIPLSPGERSDHERATREARAALGEDAFDAARDAGALLTPEQAVEEARAAFAA